MDLLSQSCFICNNAVPADCINNDKNSEMYESLSRIFNLTSNDNDNTNYDSGDNKSNNAKDYFDNENFCIDCKDMINNFAVLYEEIKKLKASLNHLIISTHSKNDALVHQIENQLTLPTITRSNDSKLEQLKIVKKRVRLQKKIVEAGTGSLEIGSTRTDPVHADVRNSKDEEDENEEFQTTTRSDFFMVKIEPSEILEAEKEPFDYGIIDKTPVPKTNLSSSFHQVGDRPKRAAALKAYKKYDSEDFSPGDFDPTFSEDDHYSDAAESEHTERKLKTSISTPASKKKSFKCEICGTNFPNAPKLARHITIHTNEKAFNCNICWKPFKTKESSINHESTHISPLEKEKPNFQCNKCSVICFTKKGMWKHKKNKHGESSIKKARSTRRNTTGGSKTSKTFACEKCPKVYNSASDFRYHLETHKPHEERRFLCDHCGRGFYKEYLLKRHKLVHAKQADPNCYEASLLKKIEPTACSICGKMVTQMNLHMKIHTGEKEFKCEICGKEFRQKKTLEIHFRIHIDEKPYECKICPMKFRNPTALKKHSFIHTLERTFICQFCGKAFRLQHCLREHLHIHTLVAPYRCNICGRRYPERFMLTEHLSTYHTPEQIEAKKKRIKQDGKIINITVPASAYINNMQNESS